MRINIKNKLFLAFAATAIFATSCKKELDLSPTDSFTEDKAFQTLDDVQRGVNTVYARMGAYANDIYESSLVSDEGKLGAGNSGQGALTYRYQYNSDGTTGGDVTGAWQSYYSAIHQINTVLPFVDKVPGDATRKTELKGQLLGLRAICHFYLLQSYSGRYNATALGVPNMNYVNIFAQPKRNTMGETMAFIEADMTSAQGLLSSATPFSDTTINKINLAGFQAKVALFKGDYQGAIDYATTVINSAVKPLASGTAYANLWQDATTVETLFRIRYATSTAIGSMFTTTGGDVYIQPSDKLNNIYAAGDARKAIFIGTVNGNRFVKKYEKSARGGRVLDMKVMRSAELYLLRAEAYSKLTTPNIAAGTIDLNALRAKRITGAGAVAGPFASGVDLTNAVLDEKFRELCFEGIRFFDLKRNYLPVQRLASDAGTAWQTLDKDNFRFVFPITADEILANPNMVQNPNY